MILHKKQAVQDPDEALQGQVAAQTAMPARRGCWKNRTRPIPAIQPALDTVNKKHTKTSESHTHTPNSITHLQRSTSKAEKTPNQQNQNPNKKTNTKKNPYLNLPFPKQNQKQTPPPMKTWNQNITGISGLTAFKKWESHR